MPLPLLISGLAGLSSLGRHHRLLGLLGLNVKPITGHQLPFKMETFGDINVAVRGRTFAAPIVQARIKLWPFKVVAGQGDKPVIVVNAQGKETTFHPE